MYSSYFGMLLLRHALTQSECRREGSCRQCLPILQHRFWHCTVITASWRHGSDERNKKTQAQETVALRLTMTCVTWRAWQAMTWLTWRGWRPMAWLSWLGWRAMAWLTWPGWLAMTWHTWLWWPAVAWLTWQGWRAVRDRWRRWWRHDEQIDLCSGSSGRHTVDDDSMTSRTPSQRTLVLSTSMITTSPSKHTAAWLLYIAGTEINTLQNSDCSLQYVGVHVYNAHAMFETWCKDSAEH